MSTQAEPRRQTETDGSTAETFALPADEASLEKLLRTLFAEHWHEITFGPIIQGAAWEIRASQPPTYFGTLDGYLTVAFGKSHFHVCIGRTSGPETSPTPDKLARHRQTARAELYRRLDHAGSPVSWGLRLFNGAGEQQMTVFFPNPFLDPETDKVVRDPDWSRLALWDELRARWTGAAGPDPFDRSAAGFAH